jgi:rubrerythrin
MTTGTTPPETLTSAEELMAIAYALELEAVARYRELAARMRLRGEDPLAGLFAFLARIEEKHAAEIDRRSEAILGKSPDPRIVRWELPENFDEEEARSAMLTPYRALAIAVRNEERTFAFYSYVASAASDDRVRTLAEELAKDELDHAALLRRERRKAYREAGAATARHALPESVEEFFALAAAWEGFAARVHQKLADTRYAAGDTEGARLFRRIAAAEAESASEAGRRAAGRAWSGAPHAPGAPTVRDGIRLLEAAFERYADIAERARNEEIVREAQRRAEGLVQLLALAGGSLENALIARPDQARR